MTTPGGSAPDGAYVIGGQYGQDITEASAKAIMKGAPVSKFTTAQNNFRGKFDTKAAVTDLAALQDRTQILEGVIGYAHAYCTGGAPVGNADTFIPLNIPVR
ncbi:hypothetical protein ACFWAM_28110, partial [Rhodococcus jostii]